MGDRNHPDHPEYGNAPTAADFCRGCGEELGSGTIGRLCAPCQLRHGRLIDLDDEEMGDDDREWIDALDRAP